MNQTVPGHGRSADDQSSIQESSSHQMRIMLIDCALERVSEAKVAIEQNNPRSKDELLSSAIAIIDGIRDCLDFKNGGEIAFNLSSLYNYIERLLVAANVLGDATLLDEVSLLLEELKSGQRPTPRDMGQGLL